MRILDRSDLLAMLSISLGLPACGAAETATHRDAALAADAPPEGPALRTQQGSGSPERPAELSCLGARGELAASADGAEFRVELRDFQLESVSAGARLHAFFDGTPVGGCAAPGCLSALTDAQGVATLRGQSGSTLRIELPAERRGENDALNIARSIAFDLRVPAAGETLRLVSISEATRRYLPLGAGLSVAPGDAVILGVARDCAGAPLKHARVRVFDPQGEELRLGASGPGVAYTNLLRRPDRALDATNFNGQFFLVNLPPGASYRVEAWGRLEGEAIPRRVACASVPTWGQAVSLRDLHPLRRANPSDLCGVTVPSP